MSEFNKLIKELKNDLRSIPSVDEKQKSPGEDVASVISSSSKGRATAKSWKNRVSTGWFVRHMMLSVEFLFFFIIFLGATRPSFLYVRQRVASTRNEVVQSKFSVIYLLSYSVFFTLVLHGLIWMQGFVVRRYG